MSHLRHNQLPLVDPTYDWFGQSAWLTKKKKKSFWCRSEFHNLQLTSTWNLYSATGGIELSAEQMYVPMWTRLIDVMLMELPSTALLFHFPESITLSPSIFHVIVGVGKPVAAHCNRKLSPSRTIIFFISVFDAEILTKLISACHR